MEQSDSRKRADHITDQNAEKCVCRHNNGR